MKLFLNGRTGRYLAAAIAGLVFVAGCSSGRPLPNAQSGPALAASSQSTAQMTVSGMRSDAIAPDACSDPAKLKICLRAGTSAKLKITLTCTHYSQSVPCGTVHWFTKTSNLGLKGSFRPDPGNPTTETITASRKIKVGHYYQTITAKCSAFKGCVTKGKGAIWVIK
ncbi:MAG: hypothetical protein WB681_10800 [Candidatus Cybelea sp.]